MQKNIYCQLQNLAKHLAEKEKDNFVLFVNATSKLGSRNFSN